MMTFLLTYLIILLAISLCAALVGLIFWLGDNNHEALAGLVILLTLALIGTIVVTGIGSLPAPLSLRR